MRPALLLTTHLLTRAALLIVVVLATATLSLAQRTRPIAKGTWGGTGFAMMVNNSGGTIQFDCADATLTNQLRMKKDGTFIAEGTLVRNGPGPVRADRQPTGRAVVFRGKVSGKSMSVAMTDSKTGEKLGEYSATQGQEARLHRCY